MERLLSCEADLNSDTATDLAIDNRIQRTYHFSGKLGLRE